jgi:ABC-type nitrate/sulfonate/bicarbonate transport system substrate-binding protein
MNDMLRNGQVDAALPVEPFAGQIAAAKTGYQFARLPLPLADHLVFSFWAARRSYVAANAAVIAAFRASLVEAIAWIKANEPEARKTQTTYLKMSDTLAGSVALPPYTATITAPELQFWIDTCKELGLTKGTVGIAEVLAK